MSTVPEDLYTKAARASWQPGASGALVTPICQTTTFVQSPDHAGPCTYSRVDNPTVLALEAALADLESAARCLAFSSGLGALTTWALGCLKAGDHVVCGESVYGGTVRLLREVLPRLGIATSFVDTSDLDRISAAIRPTTQWIVVETPTNPTLQLVDLSAVADLARRRDVKLLVDNTFLTPVLQQPLERGAHLTIYSTTKFVEGHGAAVGGALVTQDQSLAQVLHRARKSLGTIQTPFGAWVTLQGLRTLPLRLERHSASALAIAKWLASEPGIQKVIYPGLPEHPQHPLAQRQQRSGGGIVTFEVAGDTDGARRFLRELRLCVPAENLGSTETLITHSATMTHGDVPPDHRARVGVVGGLLRLSVGLESPAAIQADLRLALDSLLEVVP